MWYSEFRQNTMTNSDGISLRESFSAPDSEQGACAAYGGPWVRWSVIRGNHLAGISKAAWNESTATNSRPYCAGVSLFNQFPDDAVARDSPILNQSGATSGFEMSFAIGSQHLGVPGPNGPNQNTSLIQTLLYRSSTL